MQRSLATQQADLEAAASAAARTWLNESGPRQTGSGSANSEGSGPRQRDQVVAAVEHRPEHEVGTRGEVELRGLCVRGA